MDCSSPFHSAVHLLRGLGDFPPARCKRLSFCDACHEIGGVIDGGKKKLMRQILQINFFTNIKKSICMHETKCFAIILFSEKKY